MTTTHALHRVRSGKGVGFSDAPRCAPKMRPLRVARMLALAYEMQALIERGEVRDRAELAWALGLSRARVTQLLDLLLLAPDLQEEILFAQVLPGRDRLTSMRAL